MSTNVRQCPPSLTPVSCSSPPFPKAHICVFSPLPQDLFFATVLARLMGYTKPRERLSLFLSSIFPPPVLSLAVFKHLTASSSAVPSSQPHTCTFFGLTPACPTICCRTYSLPPYLRASWATPSRVSACRPSSHRRASCQRRSWFPHWYEVQQAAHMFPLLPNSLASFCLLSSKL